MLWLQWLYQWNEKYRIPLTYILQGRRAKSSAMKTEGVAGEEAEQATDGKKKGRNKYSKMRQNDIFLKI